MAEELHADGSTHMMCYVFDQNNGVMHRYGSKSQAALDDPWGMMVALLGQLGPQFVPAVDKEIRAYEYNTSDCVNWSLH